MMSPYFASASGPGNLARLPVCANCKDNYQPQHKVTSKYDPALGWCCEKCLHEYVQKEEHGK